MEESDKEEADVTDSIEDIITHFIQIDHACPSTGPPDDDALDDKLFFSHLFTINDANEPAAFAARFQIVAFTQAVSRVFSKLRFSTKFDKVMIATGAARESSSGSLQYQAY